MAWLIPCLFLNLNEGDNIMSVSKILGLSNTAPQAVVAGGLVNLGTVYRRFSKKNDCGVNTFDFSGTSVSLNHKGIYKVEVNAVASAPAAGEVTLQLEQNGVLIPAAFSSETITTATTELRTLTFSYFILVDNDLILNYPTTTAQSITVRNTGDASTIENIVVNITKEV